ncbi:MAG: hypothetical protein EBS48_06825 [Actinobacteria bacterium]|nr:hypothetical protein [Actinomycetota bacterium]
MRLLLPEGFPSFSFNVGKLTKAKDRDGEIVLIDGRGEWCMVNLTRDVADVAARWLITAILAARVHYDSGPKPSETTSSKERAAWWVSFARKLPKVPPKVLEQAPVPWKSERASRVAYVADGTGSTVLERCRDSGASELAALLANLGVLGELVRKLGPEASARDVVNLQAKLQRKLESAEARGRTQDTRHEQARIALEIDGLNLAAASADAGAVSPPPRPEGYGEIETQGSGAGRQLRLSNPRARSVAWTPLRVDGGWNRALLAAMDGRSGVYAVRDATTKRTLYVGESHTDRMWRTLLRHFQDPTGKFAARGEWTNATPERLEVRAWFTRADKVETECREADTIERLKPLHNRTSGVCARDDFAFGANVAENGDRLIVLGELVSVRYRPSGGGRQVTIRFSARDAPVLAYGATAKRLAIVYRPRVTGKSSPDARREYARTHWGLAGDGERLAGIVCGGKARHLGTLTEITYGTRKGSDRETVNYWHVFAKPGEGGVARPLPPHLQEGTCAGRAMLRILGGTYTVTTHGIVG